MRNQPAGRWNTLINDVGDGLQQVFEEEAGRHEGESIGR